MTSSSSGRAGGSTPCAAQECEHLDGSGNNSEYPSLRYASVVAYIEKPSVFMFTHSGSGQAGLVQSAVLVSAHLKGFISAASWLPLPLFVTKDLPNDSPKFWWAGALGRSQSIRYGQSPEAPVLLYRQSIDGVLLLTQPPPLLYRVSDSYTCVFVSGHRG